MGHYTALHLAIPAQVRAARRNGIDLVNEDDGRGLAARVVKDAAQLRLGLSIHLVDDLGPIDVREVGTSFVRDGARDERFAGAGRAIQQHALGRLDPQALENLGITERQLDHLADALDLAAQTTNILVRDRVARARLALAGDADDRVCVDQYRAGWGGLDHAEGLCARADHRNAHLVVGDDGDAVEEPHQITRLRGDGPGTLPIRGRQHDSTRWLCLHGAHRHLLTQAGTRVRAHNAIHLNQALAALGRIRRHGPRHRTALARDLQHIADADLQCLQIVRIEPHQRPPHILGQCFRHTKRLQWVSWGCFLCVIRH